MTEFTDVYAIRQLMSPFKEGASTNPLTLHVGELPQLDDFEEIANDHMEYFDSIYLSYIKVRRI